MLCATNGDGGAIEERLRAEGIDVVTETTSKLIRQRSVRALIEYLKFCYFGEAIYKENFFRITSYNVCYTKLLRMSTPIIFLSREMIEMSGQ